MLEPLGRLLRFLHFWIAYHRGKIPWDTGVVPPEVIEVIEGEQLAAGCAIDLGCGTGTNALYLARRGWEVVGVDFSEQAVARARAKLAQSGLSGVTFICGDVTKLAELGVADVGPFDFLLDIGCFHGLLPGDRRRYVQGLAPLARPGAIFLLYVVSVHFSGSSDLAAVPDEVAGLFGGAFTIERAVPSPDRRGRPSWWFRLRRKG